MKRYGNDPMRREWCPTCFVEGGCECVIHQGRLEEIKHLQDESDQCDECEQAWWDVLRSLGLASPYDPDHLCECGHAPHGDGPCYCGQCPEYKEFEDVASRNVVGIGNRGSSVSDDHLPNSQADARTRQAIGALVDAYMEETP